MPTTYLVATQLGEVLDGAALSSADLARACGVSLTWIHARVQAGILPVDGAHGAWRFTSGTLVRARRIAQLEMIYDADPQLAAFTADLIEEVRHLRQRVHALSS